MSWSVIDKNMKRFSFKFGRERIIGDVIGDTSNCSVLILHGAGLEGKGSFDGLRKRLAKDGIDSAAFDFIGHGETGGNLQESSLKNRTEQAVAVVKHLSLKAPLSVVGRSMSGYTAIKLTEALEVGLLVLIAPAVYMPQAYSVNFGEEFSKKIRATKSWENSDAWPILSRFKGNLLVIVAEKDEVIPEEVVKRIYNSAVHANRRELYTISRAPHKITQFLVENPEESDKFYQKVKESLAFVTKRSVE